jgi:high-affinity nickel-transport protein
MDGFLLIISVGLFLGMRHATDADHIVAIATIISRQRDLRHAVLTGLFWGLGHSLTILTVGGSMIYLGFTIPAVLGRVSEIPVSLMLIVLGVGSLARSARSLATAHSHGDYIHSHSHGESTVEHPHRAEQTPLGFLDRRLGPFTLYRHMRPLVVGVVHGLAGSAAITLVVLATIPRTKWAIGYLVVFGLGTIAGMMVVTVILASVFVFAGRKNAALSHWLGFASGLVSLGFGLMLARTTFADLLRLA